jgi:hypothetical protein
MGFGSVGELLELPIPLLNRYAKMMEEEGMMEKFRLYQDPFYKSKLKGGIF